jgi:hypothetical protein
MWTGRATAEPPRIVSMTGGATMAAPGETLEVHAQAQTAPGRTAQYRWQLSSRDFDFEVGRIRPSADGASAQITMPMQPGAYRLYLNVSDGTAADEANFPITVGAAPTVSPLAGPGMRGAPFIAAKR